MGMVGEGVVKIGGVSNGVVKVGASVTSVWTSLPTPPSRSLGFLAPTSVGGDVTGRLDEAGGVVVFRSGGEKRVF